MGFYTSVVKHKGNILYRGYNDNDFPTQHKYKFEPTLYVTCKEDTGWKALDGKNVGPLKFKSMWDADQFMKENSHKDMYGNTKYVDQFICEKFPKKINFKYDLINVTSLDIEVASDEGFPHADEAKFPVNAITIKSNKSDTYYVWGLDDYDPDKTTLDIDPKNIRYVKCKSEQHLLAKFLTHWSNNYPDIVTGWNVKFFDITYLVNRITRIAGSDVASKLSPWNVVKSKNVNSKYGTQDAYDVLGIEIADYMEFFIKFDQTYGKLESYSLEHVSHIVLGERKLSYEEHGSLYTLAEKDHQKFIDYNIKDVWLVNKIDETCQLINLALTMAYRSGVNLTTTLGTTNIWDCIIYRALNSVKITVPFVKPDNKITYPGGYVKEVQKGLHKWVVSFDLNSLYPNLIVQYNMSPETIIDEYEPSGVDHYLNLNDKVKSKYSVAANGSTYTKDYQGIFPRIISAYYEERKTIKKEMLASQQEYEKTGDPKVKAKVDNLNNIQMSIKLLLNSLYGAIGNQYFRYFDIRIAEGITLSGQLAIRWAEKAINAEMNKILKTDNVDYVIAIDTDSLYVSFDKFIEQLKPDDPVKALDSICEKHFVPVMGKAYTKLYEQMNCYTERMWMAREAIADTGIWMAKKRYILNVHNNEGVQYTTPKLKIMGIEAIKSSTPQVCRDKMKELFHIIVKGSEKETLEFINDFKKEFSNLSPEEVSFPRSVTDIDKWKDKRTIYTKGTPIHVRGSLLYNKAIHDKSLESRFDIISNGDKIKFTYLTLPNPIKENVISYPTFLPKEIKLHEYIDYNKQFEKTFMSAVDPIIDAIGWSTSNDTNLVDMFS